MGTQPDDGLTSKIAVVEVLDREGHPRLTVPVWRWPVTIGRAIDTDVLLDDAHVAPQHVSVFESEGVLRLRVGETINGVQWRKTRLTAGQEGELLPGEPFYVGGARVRVRRASDPLSAERPLVPEPNASRVPVWALLVALIAWTVGTQWVNTDPGSRLTDYVPALLLVPIGVVLWAGSWALGSKLFRQRYDFIAHARIALTYSLVMSVVLLALPVLAFSSGWTFFGRIAGIAEAGMTWAMLRAHLGQMIPTRRRVVTAFMAAFFLAGVSFFLIRNYQVHDRLFSQLYVTTLAPPALRLARGVTTNKFIDEARALQPVLAAHIDDDDQSDLEQD